MVRWISCREGLVSDGVGRALAATRTLTIERAGAGEVQQPGPMARTAVPRTPGSLVDRFSILGPLGSGGLGDVHAAYDPELDRKVALKFLRGVGPRSTARLLHEAQAMARLRHPNVITVYDVGVDAGEIFVAMELVDGTTLAAWQRGEPRSWTAVRDVMVAAGRGLAASHAAGVVHGDFKPDNVMIDAHGRVVVLDFGLARRQGDPDEAVAEDEAIVGTLPYMAPELFAGVAASPESDQFAFSVALWEGVHAARPFASADSIEGHVAAVAAGPVKGSARVPKWLHAAIVRGLDPRPEARHPSIDALLVALEHDHRRRRRGLLGVALVAVLGAGIGSAATMLVRPQPSADELAAIDRLDAEARLAAAHGHFLHPPVDRPEAPTALGGVLALEGIEGAAQATSRETAVRLRGELAESLVALGEQYAAQPGGEAFAADFYASALVFDPTHEGARAKAVVSPGALAVLQRAAERGEFSRAELIAAEPLAALADTEPARRLEKVAEVYAREGGISATTRERLRGLLDPAESRAAAQAERARLEEIAVGEPDIAGRAPAPETIAEAPARVTVEEPAGAPSSVNDADPRTPNDDASSRAASLVRDGRDALGRGDLDEAETRFHQALRIDRNDPAALEGLADVAFQRGEYARAAAFASRAVQRRPKSASLRIKLGDAYFKVLRYDDASEAYRKAAELGSGIAAERLRMVQTRLGDAVAR
jgi:tetratricopeptide (TPR) repeat protein/predicted Ser/Thr protein kinase